MNRRFIHVWNHEGSYLLPVDLIQSVSQEMTSAGVVIQLQDGDRFPVTLSLEEITTKLVEATKTC